MTSDTSHRPVSPLRARMIEDMTVRGFSEQTRSHYVRHVRAFTAFIGRSPDTATAEDLRLFQLHQTQIGMQPSNAQSAIISAFQLSAIFAKPSTATAAPTPNPHSRQALTAFPRVRWDPTFSEHSYGFRPGRSAHQAVAQGIIC